RTNLALRHDIAVKLVGGVGEVLVEELQPLAAGELVTLVHVDAGGPRLDGRTLLGDPGADAVHVKVHIYAIGNRLAVPVLHDKVLIEEADGLAIGRSGEPDQERVEIEQDLAPEFV